MTPAAEPRDRERPTDPEQLRHVEPRHAFFVGVDSDGCAFDTMEVKHEQCITPNTIRHFGLDAITDLVHETAAFVNLHSATRGLNRWFCLMRTFDLLRERPEVRDSGVRIPTGDEIRRFAESDLPLAEEGALAWIAQHPGEEMERAIAWNRDVNRAIDAVVTEVPPFRGVDETLERMSRQADLMVVSVAPTAALEAQWSRHGLARHLRVIGGQELGNKRTLLERAIDGRYRRPERALMIGDAPGDRDAAAATGCLFYPINPGDEEASWQRLRDEAFDLVIAGEYAGDYARAVLEDFESRLPTDPPWPT